MTSAYQLPFIDPRNLDVSHVLIDSSTRSSSETNYAYTAAIANEGLMREIVSVSLLSAIIPMNEDNVHQDAPQIYLYEHYPLENAQAQTDSVSTFSISLRSIASPDTFPFFLTTAPSVLLAFSNVVVDGQSYADIADCQLTFLVDGTIITSSSSPVVLAAGNGGHVVKTDALSGSNLIVDLQYTLNFIFSAPTLVYPGNQYEYALSVDLNTGPYSFATLSQVDTNNISLSITDCATNTGTFMFDNIQLTSGQLLKTTAPAGTHTISGNTRATLRFKFDAPTNVLPGVLRRVTATVPFGYYPTLAYFRLAVLSALSLAMRVPPLTNASDQPTYDLIYLENSRAKLTLVNRGTAPNGSPYFYSQSGVPALFLPIVQDNGRSIMRKLGFLPSVLNPWPIGFNILQIASNMNTSFTSTTPIDISSSKYVDICIDEIPTVGLKMTPLNKRLFARIPLVPCATGRLVCAYSALNLLRRQFNPIPLHKLTISLFDQYGAPFYNNNSDHSLELEIETLGARPFEPVPQVVLHPVVVADATAVNEPKIQELKKTDETVQALKETAAPVAWVPSPMVVAVTCAAVSGLYVAYRIRGVLKNRGSVHQQPQELPSTYTASEYNNVV